MGFQLQSRRGGLRGGGMHCLPCAPGYLALLQPDVVGGCSCHLAQIQMKGYQGFGSHVANHYRLERDCLGGLLASPGEDHV